MNLDLNHDGYEQYLVETTKGQDGIQYIFRFGNGYGASVIKFGGSSSHSQDLWELAVIKYDKDGGWEVCYETEVTGNVEADLTDKDVRNLLKRIKGL